MASRAMYVDIGANLLDDMFQGIYHDKCSHPPDIDNVLRRAVDAGVSSIIVTAGDLRDSQAAVALCRRINATQEFAPLRLFCTVGVHPTNTVQLASLPDDRAFAGPDVGVLEGPPTTVSGYMAAIRTVLADGASDGTVVAIGECGLDYDRLHFSDKATQLAFLPWQLALADETGLPLFLHDRGTGGEMLAVLRATQASLASAGRPLLRGVVHSFTGSQKELDDTLAVPGELYVGINGCSLKRGEGCALAAAVPLHRLLVETDAPWCGIKASHASVSCVRTVWPTVKKDKAGAGAGAGVMVKDRNEPAAVVQVVEVLASLRGVPVEEVGAATHANAMRLFGQGMGRG